MKYNSSLRNNLKKITEDNWTDYYDKIGELDFDEKTWKSRYKTRKELEAAIKKKYGWDVNEPNVKEAIDRWYNSHDDIDRYGESAKPRLRGYKTVKESAQVDDRFYGGDYPTGEVNVFSDTGAFGISVQMGRYSVGTDTSNINWHIGYCAQGPYNSGANKTKQVSEGDNVEKIVKKDLDEFKSCLKRCIDYCDKEISAELRKLGYK